MILKFKDFQNLQNIYEYSNVDRNSEWRSASSGAAGAAGLAAAGAIAAFFLTKRAIMQKKITNLVKEKTKLEDGIIDMVGTENKNKRKSVRTRLELIDDRLEAIISAHGSRINGLAEYRDLKLTEMRLKLNEKRMKLAELANDMERFNKLRDKEKEFKEKTDNLQKSYKEKFDKQEDALKNKEEKVKKEAESKEDLKNKKEQDNKEPKSGNE